MRKPCRPIAGRWTGPHSTPVINRCADSPSCLTSAVRKSADPAASARRRMGESTCALLVKYFLELPQIAESLSVPGGVDASPFGGLECESVEGGFRRPIIAVDEKCFRPARGVAQPGLARLNGVQKVGGSNPLAPISKGRRLRVFAAIVCLLSFLVFGRPCSLRVGRRHLRRLAIAEAVWVCKGHSPGWWGMWF